MRKVLQLGLAVTLVLALVVLGPLSPAQGKKPGGQPETALARANFKDGGDKIQSDSEPRPPACLPYDYADTNDPCNDGAQLVVSKVYVGGSLDGQYLLRTIDTKAPYEKVRNPTRWLVLDFTEGSPCLNLDLELSEYEGRDPEATTPYIYIDDPCIDAVEVRFAAHKAFKSGAHFTTLGILIDGPDLMQRGKKRWVQWNAKWLLEFVDPLTITPDPDPPNTVTLSTIGPDHRAELWTIGKNGEPEDLVGTYSMPFEVTITKLP